MSAILQKETLYAVYERNFEGSGSHGGDVIRELGCGDGKHAEFIYEHLVEQTDETPKVQAFDPRKTLLGKCDGSCSGKLGEIDEIGTQFLWFYA